MPLLHDDVWVEALHITKWTYISEESLPAIPEILGMPRVLISEESVYATGLIRLWKAHAATKRRQRDFGDRMLRGNHHDFGCMEGMDEMDEMDVSVPHMRSLGSERHHERHHERQYCTSLESESKSS